MDHTDLPITVGEQVGRYTVESSFGSHTASDQLFLARHAVLDRNVLLKFISPASDMGIERIQHEARILAGLHHPNIITVYDVDFHNGQPYLVLSYEPGSVALTDMIQTGNTLLPTVVLSLMGTICAAVSHAHAQGLIHRDIKPSNILIGYDGTPILMGFSIAVPASGDPFESPGVSIGTPPYMSPEQCRGDQLTPASDIWSMGVTLYTLLIGYGPFDGHPTPMDTLYAIAAPEPVDLTALYESVAPSVIAILERCLHKDPSARFASAEEVRQALNAALIELEVSVDATAHVSVPSAGARLLLYSDHPATDRPGHYRHYQIRALLGSGSFADVYHAVDTISGDEVALKILKQQWLTDTQMVMRFRREATLLARLAHPNIVTIYDYGRYGESFYLVLEILHGQTLAEYLREHPILTPAEAAALLIPVLRGLDAAHRLNIIHRDLKPANIVVAHDRIIILDFGIAYSTYTTRITGPGALIGTAAYMSPEQTRDEMLTTASDLYAVGTILYEMLTGYLPYESDSLYALLAKLAAGAAIPITDRRTDLPPLIVQLVAMLHHPQSSERPTARDTAELLTIALGHPSVAGSVSYAAKAASASKL